MSSRIADALALADETLAQLEMGEGRLAPLVLRCLRLARLMGHVETEQWLQCELRGYGPHVVENGNWAEFASWSGRESSQDEQGRQRYYTAPIEVIEAELELALGGQRGWQAPASIGEPVPNITDIRRWTRIMATLRGSVHDWLSWAVIELRYGTVVDTAFQRTKQRFDTFLADRAPDVSRALAAAFVRSGSSEPEEWSQALTGCSRALKALADALQPRTDERPFGQDVGEDDYKDRLIQFASDRLTSEAQRELVEAEIDLVTKRADALESLASKGVDGEADTQDLELTAVQTYLLAGELLALLPGDGPREFPARRVGDHPAATDVSQPGEVGESPQPAGDSSD